jgi:preprotein translocase subunit Sec63
MSGFDWLVVIVMAVVGWLIVSYVLKRLKPSQSVDDRPMPVPAERSTPRLPAPASPADIGARPGLLSLEVSSDASATQIESAYHAKLAHCDRIRFAVDATPENTRLAEERRAQICQAYEFIRPLRP